MVGDYIDISYGCSVWSARLNRHSQARQDDLFAAHVLALTLEVHPYASNMPPRASNVHPPAANVDPPALNARPQALNAHPRAANVHPRRAAFAKDSTIVDARPLDAGSSRDPASPTTSHGTRNGIYRTGCAQKRTDSLHVMLRGPRERDGTPYSPPGVPRSAAARSICSRRLFGRMSVQLSSMYARQVARAPRGPTVVQPPGTSLNEGHSEYCP